MLCETYLTSSHPATMVPVTPSMIPTEVSLTD